MSPILRTYRNQTWDSDGNLIEDETVQVDVTEEVNGNTVRQFLDAARHTNKAYIALANPTGGQTAAEVKALAKQLNWLMRVVLNRFEDID